MPNNPESRAAKSSVRSRVEQYVGDTVQGRPRRPDWRVASTSGVSVFLTFSRADQLFYDVNRSDLDRWLEHPRAFVAFVMGHADDVLIVPVSSLDKHLDARAPSEGGNYKLHLQTTLATLHFREMPSLDLTPFRNNYALLAGDSVIQIEEPAAATREFSVVVEQDEDGYYVATVPSLAGCHTQARSLDVLMERVREAIALCLEVEEAPAPLHFVGVQRVAVAA